MKFTEKQKKRIFNAFLKATKTLHKKENNVTPATWLSEKTSWNHELCRQYVKGIRPVDVNRERRVFTIARITKNIVTPEILRPDIFKITRK